MGGQGRPHNGKGGEGGLIGRKIALVNDRGVGDIKVSNYFNICCS